MTNQSYRKDPAAPLLPSDVEAAARHLRQGGVAAIPTDTIYGLAANALDEQAVRRVFRLKRRPAGMALPLLLADAAGLDRWAREAPALALLLAERFWPGALTLVVRKAADIPDVATGGLDTVALRVPAHDTPRALARLLGGPITGTSANRSGSPGLTDADAVRREFAGEPCLVVEGQCDGGVASTLVDVTGERPRIIRQGAVSRRELEEACGGLDFDGGAGA